MYILDTNVLSELIDPEGEVRVLAWINTKPREDLFTTALNKAEILYGTAIMPEGRRRRTLQAWAETMFVEDFSGRILAFDEHAAEHFAAITANRKRLGEPVGILDSQIAAIARSHQMTVVTRNTRHFVTSDVPVVNPWSL